MRCGARPGVRAGVIRGEARMHRSNSPAGKTGARALIRRRGRSRERLPRLGNHNWAGFALPLSSMFLSSGILMEAFRFHVLLQQPVQLFAELRCARSILLDCDLCHDLLPRPHRNGPLLKSPYPTPGFEPAGLTLPGVSARQRHRITRLKGTAELFNTLVKNQPQLGQSATHLGFVLCPQSLGAKNFHVVFKFHGTSGGTGTHSFVLSRWKTVDRVRSVEDSLPESFSNDETKVGRS